MAEHCDSVDQVPVVLRLLHGRFRRMADVPIWGGAELEHLVGGLSTTDERGPAPVRHVIQALAMITLLRLLILLS